MRRLEGFAIGKNEFVCIRLGVGVDIVNEGFARGLQPFQGRSEKTLSDCQSHMFSVDAKPGP